jgi:hypothetical protein
MRASPASSWPPRAIPAVKYVFGVTQGTAGALYNQVIDQHHYLTQEVSAEGILEFMTDLAIWPIDALTTGQLARVQAIYEDAFSQELRVPFSELTRAGAPAVRGRVCAGALARCWRAVSSRRSASSVFGIT